MLFAFFLPGVALSRFGARRKAALVDVDKRKARDARQVFANGGAAAAAALAYAFTRSPIAAAAFAGAFAAAAADTFGTELGTLAGMPRSIVSFRPIARGLSGGVTVAGTLAEIAGALLVALCAWPLGVAVWWIVAVAGFAGALVDSLAGATVQALHYCSRCERHCENDPHVCGSHAPVVRGSRAVGNDAVNALATAAGAAVAGGLAAIQLAAF